MSLRGEVAFLPEGKSRAAVERVLENENILDCELTVTSASGKGDNYLGVLYRIDADGHTPDGAPTSLQLLLKVPPASASMREKFPVGIIYAREILGYTQLLPELCRAQDENGIPDCEQFHYAKCYDTASEAPDEHIILQHLGPLGFEMANRRNPLDLAHIELVIQTLARFHALSFYMKSKNPVRYRELVDGLGAQPDFPKDKGYFLDIARDRALEALRDPDLIERVKNFGSESSLYDKMLELMLPEPFHPYTVICHGDCWNNNMLFKYKNGKPVDMRLVDWQILKEASPITDFTHLIFSSTDEDFRRDHWEHILTFYHSTLARRLADLGIGDLDLYPEEVFRQQVKSVMPFGLIMSFIMTPVVVNEAEDALDMEGLLNKENLEIDDFKIGSEVSKQRYEKRITGIIRDFVRMKYI